MSKLFRFPYRQIFPLSFLPLFQHPLKNLPTELAILRSRIVFFCENYLGRTRSNKQDEKDHPIRPTLRRQSWETFGPGQASQNHCPKFSWMFMFLPTFVSRNIANNPSSLALYQSPHYSNRETTGFVRIQAEFWVLRYMRLRAG